MRPIAGRGWLAGLVRRKWEMGCKRYGKYVFLAGGVAVTGGWIAFLTIALTNELAKIAGQTYAQIFGAAINLIMVLIAIYFLGTAFYKVYKSDE